jgi:hypothetical protein
MFDQKPQSLASIHSTAYRTFGYHWVINGASLRVSLVVKMLGRGDTDSRSTEHLTLYRTSDQFFYISQTIFSYQLLVK